MTGTFLQPNFETQTGTLYKQSLDNSIAVMARLAAAFAPHEQDTPNMTVRVNAGDLWVQNALVQKAAQNSATITAPTGTDHRIDRIVIDAITGAVSVITGTPGASPTVPTITTGKLPICQVALAHGMTVITNALITDERVGGAGGGSGEIYKVGDLYLTTTTYADSAAVAAALGYGTWESFGTGRMPVGFDVAQTEFNAVEKTGGAKTSPGEGGHSHNTPNHQHVLITDSVFPQFMPQEDMISQPNKTDDSGAGGTTSNGGFAAKNILNPYIVIFMWKRTA